MCRVFKNRKKTKSLHPIGEGLVGWFSGTGPPFSGNTQRENPSMLIAISSDVAAHG